MGYNQFAHNPTVLEFTKDDAKILRDNYELTYDGGSLFSLREQLFEGATGGLCGMCGAAQAGTLDHYLPREMYPELSILAPNLIPACDMCNRKKSTIVGDNDSGRFAHPYIDDLSDLDGIVVCEFELVEEMLIPRFSINEHLPDDVRRVAYFHFDKLDLAGRYGASAAVEILENSGLYREYYEIGGAQAVSSEASRKVKSLLRKFSAIYWKVALYQGIERSELFCNGGFERISA
ncbi:HNH endonuclease [Nocardia sp. 852002-20019_SCH5090214]|uniref:HNH endonuclease n=1 Tax=Nocardia sp. 852002-20019_SCH5090214 TaxID=1834087 RepID=UPI0012EA254C|nr:HNH endonuclease signature motif containing protein [Nocardia sp. 852002-20019_SCH5090214]